MTDADAHDMHALALGQATPSPDLAAAPGGWRWLKSAPKDGTPILVTDTTDPSRTWVVRWQNGEWRPTESTCVLFVTHWQPLPAPPGASPAAETAPGVEWLGGFRADDPFGRCDARLPPSKAHELAPAAETALTPEEGALIDAAWQRHVDMGPGGAARELAAYKETAQEELASWMRMYREAVARAEAAEAKLAAETAPDAGLVEALKDIRRRSVQAIGAGLSRRDWNHTEIAYNELRDGIDRILNRAALSRAGERT